MTGSSARNNEKALPWEGFFLVILMVAKDLVRKILRRIAPQNDMARGSAPDTLFLGRVSSPEATVQHPHLRSHLGMRPYRSVEPPQYLPLGEGGTGNEVDGDG